jgi:DNA (cytosine-5)-methyltransferase 1
MRYLSLFSGIGGFELGITQAYESNNRELLQGEATENIQDDSTDASLGQTRSICIGFSEIDKYATQIYQSHFPEHKNYGDITKINEKELPDFDLVVGGFPCQSFSIAGKRGGFNDTRGTLFFEIARIIREKQPRLLLLENVKGLLSHDNGKTFLTIISMLDELGYDLQWQVLNSKNFGVPQNRERVFIIGHLRGTPRPEVFPFGETDGTTDTGFEPRDTEVASTLRSRYGNGTGSHIQQLNNPTHSNDRVYGADGISPTLNTMQGGMRQPFVKDEIRIRRLTPVECERLQGFPDGWTSGVSDTQRYKTLGNAVTVNVIREIMTRLK